MTLQLHIAKFNESEGNADPVTEAAGHGGIQYGVGMARSNPAAREQMAQGIIHNQSPAVFIEAINAAQSALGNRNFMRFVGDVQQLNRTPDAHSIAAQGIQGPGRPMTHLDVVQKAFGHHDVSSMREHTGSEARASLDALGAAGYSSQGRMAFSGMPDLFSQAHEAAHGVQQVALGGGMRLKGGIGEEGDRYERHADAVAQAVVKGESAESLLDRVAGGPTKAAAETGNGNDLVQMMWPNLFRLGCRELLSVPALRSGVPLQNRSVIGRNLLLSPKLNDWNKDILFGTNHISTLELAIKQEAATDSIIPRSIFVNLDRVVPPVFPNGHLWSEHGFKFADRNKLTRRDLPYMDYAREAIATTMERGGNIYWALGHLHFDNVLSDLFRVRNEYDKDPVKYMAEISYPELMDKHGKFIDAATGEEVAEPKLDLNQSSVLDLDKYDEFHEHVEQGLIKNITPFQPLITTIEIIGFLMGDEGKFLDGTTFFNRHHREADREAVISAFSGVLDQLLTRQAELNPENQYKLEKPVYRPLDRYSSSLCEQCDAVFATSRELIEHWERFPDHMP